MRIRDEAREWSKEGSFPDASTGEMIECTLSQLAMMRTRYLLWGDHRVKGSLPYKSAMGKGFRVYSSASKGLVARLRRGVATDYVGCMH